MKKTMYNYNISKNYILNKINIYAYSFLDVDILNKNKKFNIDLNSVISNISDVIGSNDKLNKLRNDNHKKYYSIDIKFVKEVDNRYQEQSKIIINEYNQIDSMSLLKDDYEHAREKSIMINEIIDKVDNLAKDVEIQKMEKKWDELYEQTHQESIVDAIQPQHVALVSEPEYEYGAEAFEAYMKGTVAEIKTDARTSSDSKFEQVR